jgi:hypothetical protein
MSKENDGTDELPEKKQVVTKKFKIQINERWYGNDPPHWENAPTTLDAWKDREAAVSHDSASESSCAGRSSVRAAGP